MWDSSTPTDATDPTFLDAQNQANSSQTLSFIGQQFKYMDFYPENLGSYFHMDGVHRKLNSTATDFYTQNKSWIDGLAIAFGVQAVLGFIAVEYAFYRCKRLIHSKDEDRDRKFAPFVRLDTDRWYRLKFYPGAMLSMPARLLLLNIMGLILMIIGR